MTHRAPSDEVAARGPRVGIAVPAAGSGQRMGGTRKPFLELAGEPILVHALRPFLADDRVVAVVVALSADDAADPPRWLSGLDPRIDVVVGGATRSDSVARILDALPEDLDAIAVHDAARPLVSVRVVRACLDAAIKGRSAVAASACVDTIKRVDEHRVVVDTPDRARLWQAHTPQAFPARLLRDAYAARDGSGATDDASLVEATGAPVRLIDDGGTNLKVTRPRDLAVAEALLAASASAGDPAP